MKQSYQELLDTLGLLPGEKRELGPEYLEGIREIALSLQDKAGDLLQSPLPQDPQGILDILISVRQEARAQKDFQLSDQLRDALKKEGIILEDTPRGTRWRLV